MFFHLYVPEYADETERVAKNCCFQDPDEALSMPGIACSDCGVTWVGSGEYLVIDVPLSSALRKQLSQPRAVPIEEYEILLKQLLHELGLPSTTKVLPGTEIGQLALRCECTEPVEDFMWDIGALVVVTQRVVDCLSSAGLTGYRVYPARVTNVSETTIELPPLYQLLIVGQGGPMGPEAELCLVSECSRCGHRLYKDIYQGGFRSKKFQGLFVDRDVWDGSDFFTFDDWPTIIMITEKARSVLSSAGLSNWRACPAPLGALKW